ncbi:MAG: hypothetical protein QG656_2740, partial [Candidatus Hydrogenedentes bacterium]|nr:hypothetical protein [Candidatus Hydrogenedentota bacterium]
MDSSKKEDVFVRLEESITSWNADMTDAHQGLTRQISQAKEHLDSLVNILSTRRTASPTLTAAKAKIESLTKELTAHEEAAKKAASQIADLERGLMELRADLESLRAREARARSAERLLTAELDVLRAEKEATASSLSRTRAEIESLQGALSDRDASIVTLKQRLAALDQSVTRQQDDLDKLRAAETRAHAKERALTAELDAVTAEKNAAQRALKEASEEADSYRRLLSERDHAADSATHQTEQLQQTVSQLHAELQSLLAQEAQLAAAEGLAAELDLARAAQAERYEVWAPEIAALREILAERETALDAAQEEASRLRQRASGLEAALEPLRRREGEMTKDIERLKAECASASRAAETAS